MEWGAGTGCPNRKRISTRLRYSGTGSRDSGSRISEEGGSLTRFLGHFS